MPIHSSGNSSSGTLKNNFNATRAPTQSDNGDLGYAAGSVWVYNAVTYTCVSITSGVAVWRSEASTQYVDDWDSAVAWLLTGDHAGWFIVMANGNGAPDPSVGAFAGTSASRTASLVITDGGAATIKVNSSSALNYSVTTQNRTVTNPVVTAIKAAANTVASVTNDGFYIWTTSPADSASISGFAINAIVQRKGGVWSVFQTYANAPNSVLVGSGSTQYGIFKNGWMWLKGVRLSSASIVGYGITNAPAQGVYGTVNKSDASVRSTNITPTAGGWAEVTVTQAGPYRVSAACGLYANNAGSQHLVLRKNGVAISADMKVHIAAGTSTCPVAAAQIDCVVGDVLQVQILSDTASYGVTGWYFDVQQMPSIALTTI